MEKLELKHIAPYLPYRLKCTNSKESYLQTGEDRTGILETLGVNDEECVIMGEDGYFLTSCDDIVPILRPIEDLYIPETDCGIKIVHYFNFKTSVKLDCINFPYHVIEQLFQNHFDVFGLIDKGLAISKPFSEL
jgi:hypothetical protein